MACLLGYKSQYSVKITLLMGLQNKYKTKGADNYKLQSNT